MKPRVSVIIPFFNAERYLAEAIESVQAQTLTVWELLLVDDASTDASVAIAARYAAADPERIRLLGHADGANHGPAAARNLALAAAAGDYVAFLDADDHFLSDKLATETALMDALPQAAMLYGATARWYPDGTQPEKIQNIGITTECCHPPPDLARRVILDHEGAVPCICGVLLRREAALAVGGFEARFRLYEDQTLWAKLFLRYPVHVSSHCLARYRQHAASSSALARQRKEYSPWWPNPATRAFLDWMETEIAASGVNDVPLRKSLDKALMPYRHPVLWHAWNLPGRILRGVKRRVGMLPRD